MHEVKRPISKRDRAMKALYDRGASLREVGAKYDLSGQRIMQLFKRAGFKVRSKSVAHSRRYLRRTVDVNKERRWNIVLPETTIQKLKIAAATRNKSLKAAVVEMVNRAYGKVRVP